MHPDGSVTSKVLRIRLHRLSAVPALLVCYAIVFNFGPFAKVAQHDAVRDGDGPAIATARIAQPRALPDLQGDDPPSSTAAIGRAEAIATTDDTVVRASQAPLDLTLVNAAAAATPTADVKVPTGPTQQAGIEGIWAPSASSCSLRDLRDGSLATIIGLEGARAGDTYCAFKNQKQTPTGWRVVARCANAQEHWTADVRLTVKDDHLTWISRRGRQDYTRCAPDAVMTAAR